MEYTRNYLVHYYEADSARRLTPQGLIQYFEDISILHTSSLGYDLAWYEANNCGWMLLKWDIRIHRLPVFGETVRIVTSVHSMKRFLSDRVFEVRDGEGRVLAVARSVWLLVDTVRRRPMRVPDEQLSKYGILPESEKDFVMIDDVPPAVPAGAGDDGHPAAHRRTVRAGGSDIDTNSHVNNVRYLAWALDSLPRKFGTELSPVSIRVQYKKELNFGDEAEVLSLEYAPAGDGSCATKHTIMKGPDEICSMDLSWKAGTGNG